jgi:hypothetical protein
MKNYKLFAYTDEEKEAVFEKAWRLGTGRIYASDTSNKFVYIHTERGKPEISTYYDYPYFERNTYEYISVHNFLALPEPKKEFPFKAGDKIIVKGFSSGLWYFDFFSHLRISDKTFPFHTIGSSWGVIAPFEGNEDKPGTLGTLDDAIGVWTSKDIKTLFE